MRQLPRKSRIIRPVRNAANDGFTQHALNSGAHEDGLIEEQLQIERGRQGGTDARQDDLDLADDFAARLRPIRALGIG